MSGTDMILGALQTFVGEYLTLGLALAALVGAGACYLRLPLFGKEAAIVLVAVATGLSAYSRGYAARADLDRSSELRTQIEQLREDAANSRAVAEAANARTLASEADRDSDHEKAEKLSMDLAAAQRDCAIPDDVRQRLRAIGGKDQPEPAAPARRLRAARAAPKPVRQGAFATLAAYRAALAEANRRLSNDLSFYDDVRRRFGTH